MEIKIIAVLVLVLTAVCLGVIIAQEPSREKDQIYDELEDLDDEN